jgi:hypothetical protein
VCLPRKALRDRDQVRVAGVAAWKAGYQSKQKTYRDINWSQLSHLRSYQGGMKNQNRDPVHMLGFKCNALIVKVGEGKKSMKMKGRFYYVQQLLRTKTNIGSYSFVLM